MTSYAIVPAAGRSRRMGSPKLLLPWGETTLIERVLAAWRGSRVDAIVVVVHPDDEALARRCRAERVTVVFPAVAPPEMKDSVVAGLRHVQGMRSPRGDDCWLLAPADLPSLSADTIDRLLTASAEKAGARNDAAILVPIHGGRRGHPVLFPWTLAAEVFALPATEGVNQLLRRHRVVEVPCGPEAIGEDVDTADDYRRLVATPPSAETPNPQAS